MPYAKKRRFAKKKVVKRSYAMVPRPRLNGELAHRHIVTCSTSTGTGAAPLFVQYSNVTGVTNFVAVPGISVISPNLSLSWSLANMVVGIGGNAAITVPVPNIAELQQLYDTFQIERVEVTVFFGNTESLVSGDPSSGLQWVLPLIGYAPDTDDAANTSITQLQQYSTYKCHQSSGPIKMSVVPCSAGQTYDPGAGAGVGYTRLQRQDINVGYADTPHYGLKMAVDGFRATPPGAGLITYMSIQSRIHLLMKNTR